MNKPTPNSKDDLHRFLDASESFEASQSQLEALAQSEAVTTFQNEMALLKRHLLKEPRAFRDIFIADGTNAIVHEFQQDALSERFTKTFWELLLRDNDTSQVLMLV